MAATITKPMTPAALFALKLSVAAIITYQILLFALIFIRPELDASWQPISEYARGDLGWIMVLAFLISATSYGALFVALKSQARTILGRIGLSLLLICAIGTIGACVFVTDPIQTPQAELSTTGQLHQAGASNALMLFPFAALLISLSLTRNQAWAIARKILIWIAGLPLLGLIAFWVSMGVIVPADGHYGPGVNIGWPNRLLLLVYMVWLVTLGWQAIKAQRQRSSKPS